MDGTSTSVTDEAPYKANYRFATRPLSYKYREFAIPKELIVDYEKGNIYIVDENGDFHDLSITISRVLIELLKKDPTILTGDDIVVEVPTTDPETGEETVTLVTITQRFKDISAHLSRHDAEILDLQTTAMDYLDNKDKIDTIVEQLNVTDEGGLTIDATQINGLSEFIVTNTETGTTQLAITPDAIVTDEDHQFITQEQKEKLDQMITVDPETGDPVIAVSPTDIQTDTTHQFVTQEEKTSISNIDNKTETAYYEITVPSTSWTGTESPYTATITGSFFKANMNSPIMDLRCSSMFSSAQAEIEAYQIYKATTADGSVCLYNLVKPNVDIKLVFEIKTPTVAIITPPST